MGNERAQLISQETATAEIGNNRLPMQWDLYFQVNSHFRSE